MKHRKIRIFPGILLVIILLAVIGIFSFFQIMKKNSAVYQHFDFTGIDLSAIEDGNYTGSEDGGVVKASVEVTIKNHAIAHIEILSHDNGKGKPAEVITDDIVTNNSLDVDTISGATYSSNVIKMAAYNALKQ